ncbi:MAG: DUF1194 domain-containing protein [Rhodobacteraceae bacterium]|nr:DUF1194 domain-containing protein [Paracoccaceae bacterium]
MKILRAVALAVVGVVTPATALSFECKAALALALDMSKSVDAAERQLQARGLAAALLSEPVQAAILSPKGSGVMAAAYLWGGGYEQELIVGWTRLDSRSAIEQFAAHVARRGRHGRGRATAVGEALRYGAYLHGLNQVPCGQRIIDVSGDGVNNNGRKPAYFRDRGVLEGLRINGLVIVGATPDPASYYLDEVIQGPGAFVIDIDDYTGYAAAMERKLLRELSPSVSMKPHQGETAPPSGG